LSQISGNLRCENCQKTYSVENDFVDFIDDDDFEAPSWLIGNLFDWIHPIYDSLYFPLLYRIGALPRNHSVKQEVDELVERTRAKNGRVLDVACGTGLLTGRLAEVHQRVFGIDLSSGMLEEAIDRTSKALDIKTEYARAKAKHLPFGENFFDAVTCSGAIYFFPDLDTVLSEIGRVLRPNARLAGMTIVDEGWMDNPLSHAGLKLYQQFETYRLYEIDELFDRLRSHGFRQINHTVYGSMLLFDALN
jgi:ubiquinone/menaquinone biosynthesis C-methylase UbiE